MRWRVLTLVALAVVLGTPVPAVAIVYSDGDNTGDGGAVEVGTYDESPGQAGPATPAGAYVPPENPVSTVECVYYESQPENEPPQADPGTFEEGQHVFQVCTDTATGEIVFADEIVWDPAAPQAALPTVPPEVLAEHARAELVLPLPVPRAWPGIERPQTTGVETWLHVDNFDAAERTATAGAVSATVHATPVSVRWEMGDGATVTCAGAGPTYAGEGGTTDCGHVFTERSTSRPDRRFHGSVTITWALHWDATTGDGGDLGTVSRTTPIAWNVREIQATIR